MKNLTDIQAAQYLLAECEKLSKSPERLARMRARAIEHPEMTRGETLAEFLGIGRATADDTGEPLGDAD